MRVYDIIAAKRDGRELTPDEIGSMISGYTAGDIPDYQMSAWLMAICIRGMTDDETLALTQAMVASGEVLDLSSIPGVKIDKHSTGGVGDKTTLVLVPLLAAAGLKVAKMSGRSLGHTGGTIDKLESIPGMSLSLDRSRFLEQVRGIGMAISAQTDSLAPADRKIYALRDATATVESVPLIAASVMSKKIAAGADVILLDVKCGSGAFMKNLRAARELARTMTWIGERSGRRVAAAITDMDQPLGMAIGNSLEVGEAIETLSGGGPRDLRELCLGLGALGMSTALGASRAEAEEHLASLLASGAAREKLARLITAQGGDARVIDDPSILPQAQRRVQVAAEDSGYVVSVDAEALGTAAMMLGAGRMKKDDAVDPSAGIILRKKVGDAAARGEVLADLLYNPPIVPEAAARRVRAAFVIGPEPPRAHSIILETC